MLCPFEPAVFSDVAVASRQAAGERRGEGEPVLDRRSAPSHRYIIMRGHRKSAKRSDTHGNEMDRCRAMRLLLMGRSRKRPTIKVDELLSRLPPTPPNTKPARTSAIALGWPPAMRRSYLHPIAAIARAVSGAQSLAHHAFELHTLGSPEQLDAVSEGFGSTDRRTVEAR
jgi:hypothetical protein